MAPHEFGRRAFLHTAAGAAAAAVMGPASDAGESKMKNVRIGMVGVGSRGMGLLDGLTQLPGVQIPAVCDIREDRAGAAQDRVEKALGKRPTAYTHGERDFENLCRRDDLDAVITATPWEWHTPVMVAAMRAGKCGGVEVPAGLTVQECWELVKTSEETGKPCMMLENVNYFQNVLTVLRLVREGRFGELLHCEAGYQHDVRFVNIGDNGELLWRGVHAAAKNGNLYPTHPIGPIAWWMNINRGDRFSYLTSMSAPARGLKDYAKTKFGEEHPQAKRDYALGRYQHHAHQDRARRYGDTLL